jgi:glutamine cyclotransferase
MKDKYIYILSLVLTVGGLTFIGFVYGTQPRSFAEITTKGQVVLGTYAVDQTAFDEGMGYFKRDAFPSARAAFDRADPEKRDARTQFYIAYSYYRQGWGRVSNDDALFTSGLESVNRAIAADPAYRATDASLLMKTPAELKNELQEGLKVTADDFNPLKLVRERK